MSEIIVPVACVQSLLAYKVSEVMYGRGEIERDIAGVSMIIIPTILIAIFRGPLPAIEVTASLLVGAMAVGFGKLYRMYEDRRNDECLR